MKITKEDSIRQQTPERIQRPRMKSRVSRWAAAAALGLYALVASPGQFLNTGSPIPLAFTY